MEARSSWATGQPVRERMVAMGPVRRNTVHYDGMTAFTSTHESASRSRMDNIRAAHQGRVWGDVGYHYLIDPAGRVWEGRPLGFQGAHVRNHNEGNIGICMLGNYMHQQPNRAQLRSLETTIGGLMQTHRVGVSNVYTHRELGNTSCPGTFMQRAMDNMRTKTGVLASV